VVDRVINLEKQKAAAVSEEIKDEAIDESAEKSKEPDPEEKPTGETDPA